MRARAMLQRQGVARLGQSAKARCDVGFAHRFTATNRSSAVAVAQPSLSFIACMTAWPSEDRGRIWQAPPVRPRSKFTSLTTSWGVGSRRAGGEHRCARLGRGPLLEPQTTTAEAACASGIATNATKRSRRTASRKEAMVSPVALAVPWPDAKASLGAGPQRSAATPVAGSSVSGT